jgi:hypothetical protein
MRWRDIRFEQPTAADADESGGILQLLNTGSICRWNWSSTAGAVAWMPLSELPAFDPIPDPPEGWRFVEAGEAFDKRAMFWFQQRWEITCNLATYDPHSIYIVPIDPPEPPKPQYRPFANAAEFEPYRDRWVRRKEGMFCKVASYENYGATMGTCATIWKYSDLFDEWEFDDGTPFGIKVEP